MPTTAVPPPMHSAIYEGSTTHSRRTPTANRFTYRVYMGYIDLDEAQSGRLDCWPLFSTRTPFALLSLLSRDHLFNEPAEKDLQTRVRDVIERETGKRPAGAIRLLTNLRVCGVEFNPVSFYYVFDERGEVLEAVVAEVSNFPWFEQHSYVVTPTESDTTDWKRDALRRFSSHDKAFHVSPFMDIPGVRYDWLIGVPHERVAVRIELQQQEQGFFSAGLDARRLVWSKWNLIRMQLSYPAHTMAVMTGILYEASKLFRKGLQFFPHPTGTTTRLSSAVEVVVGAALGAAQTVKWVIARPRAGVRA